MTPQTYYIIALCLSSFGALYFLHAVDEALKAQTTLPTMTVPQSKKHPLQEMISSRDKLNEMTEIFVRDKEIAYRDLEANSGIDSFHDHDSCTVSINGWTYELFLDHEKEFITKIAPINEEYRVS